MIVFHNPEDALQAFDSNRLVHRTKESGYQGLGTLKSPLGGWSQGVKVRLKEVPFGAKRFKLVATNGEIEWAITNPLERFRRWGTGFAKAVATQPFASGR